MKNTLIAILCLSLTACASTYRPVVDTAVGAGVSPAQYEQDLAQCRTYAGDDARAGVAAIIGGVIGAGIGLLAVAGTGLKNDAFRNVGMGVGAVSAGVGAMKGQRDIIARCMAGRGYSVLQ